MPLLELLENWGKLTRFIRVTGGARGVRFASVARIKIKP